MSFFRKTLSLAVCMGLAFGSVDAVYAQSKKPPMKKGGGFDPTSAENRKKYTTRTYDSTNFCERDAESMIEKLNQANKKNTDRLEELQTEIEAENAYMSTLNGVTALKDQYERSLKAISDSHKVGPEQKEQIQGKNLDDLKATIRSALALNAVALLVKDSDVTAVDSSSMKSLCERKENASTTICKSDVFAQSPDLDNTLKGFQAAFKRVPPVKKELLRSDVSNIINKIPKKMSPDIILKTIQEKAPDTTLLLSSEIPKETLMACLADETTKGSRAACEKIANKPASVEKLLQGIAQKSQPKVIIANENKNVGAAIASLSSIIDESAEQSIAETNKDIAKFESSKNMLVKPSDVEDQERSSIVAENKKFERQSQEANAARKGPESKLVGMEKLFYTEPRLSQVGNDSELEKAQDDAVKKAVTEAKEWKALCLEPKKSDAKVCQEKMKVLSPKIVALKTNYVERIKALQNEVKLVSQNKDGSFGQIENLKKYVAEKFLRTCNQKPKEIKMKDESIVMGINVDGTCYSSAQKLVTLEGLNKDVSSIIAKTKFANTIIATPSSRENTFSKGELEAFNKTCEVAEFKNSFSDICSSIEKEKIAVIAIQESETVKADKLQEMNDKYWIKPDPSAPGGYTRTAKKSTARIIGEGILPIAPSLIPMWLGNYQLKQSINSLTDQAIYQKQMLYTTSIYNQSPWMYNYNYFGGAFANPFNAFGSSIGTTATTTNSSGFNFGQ